MVKAERFDADYYRKFYRDRSTRVSDRAAVRKLARFVAGYMSYLELPVRSVLDVGCGLGLWQQQAATQWPRARYFGVEQSSFLCEQHGWTQASIVDLDPTTLRRSGKFDLIICQGVLQYLGDRDAARAIRNLAEWCTGALYLEALTQRDWDEHCDRARTDGAVNLRAGSWYRRRLRRHFHECGGGLYASRDAGVTLFELEGS